MVADPDRVGTVYDCLEQVTLVFWLLGSAGGGREALEAIHGPRLERLLEKVVDTPVRGFVYEAAGVVPAELLGQGAALVAEAGERWRIPVEVVAAEPGDPASWLAAMLSAAQRLTR
ncbi:MAG: hypothetical protein ABI726_04960 [bacterium]